MPNRASLRSSRALGLLATIVSVSAGGSVVQAQVSDTLLVDTQPESTTPSFDCRTLEQDGVGQVSICANVSDDTGDVEVTVTLFSERLDGVATLAGLLQCGDSGGDLLVINETVRPGWQDPWTETYDCPTDGRPIFYVTDLGLLPD